MGILDHIHHSTSDTPASTQSTHSTYTDGANDPPPAYNNLDGASPSVLFPEKSHQSQQHYQPQQQPSNPVQLTGLNIQFCHQETIHLVMDQAWSLSGGDFTVTLADGTPIVRCEGNSWSMSKRVGFHDPGSNELIFTVRKELMSFGAPNYYIEQPRTEASLAEITGRASFSGAAKFEINFPNIADFVATNPGVVGGGSSSSGLKAKRAHLVSSGNFNDREVFIEAVVPGGNVPVAKAVREQFRFKGAKWEVEIMPGVDAVFIVAILSCVNSRRNEHH